MMKNMAALLFVMLLPHAAFAGEPVRDTSYIAGDSRVLRHEVVIAASPAEVFAAFTTEDGWRSWATPFVKFTPAQLTADGEIESAYKLDATPGEDTNIRQRILAFIPNRMLAFRVVQAPKGFPHPKEILRIFSVAEFEPLGQSRTRLRLSMIGYGAGARFDGLYAFFAKDNPWALAQLVKRFETGPADWKKLLAKPAH